jgi:hypothetical protein
LPCLKPDRQKTAQLLPFCPSHSPYPPCRPQCVSSQAATCPRLNVPTAPRNSAIRDPESAGREMLGTKCCFSPYLRCQPDVVTIDNSRAFGSIIAHERCMVALAAAPLRARAMTIRMWLNVGVTCQKRLFPTNSRRQT